MSRLGVERALVAGRWVDGDLDVVDDRIGGVGLSGPARGRCAVAGFVDLQVNGAGDVDLTRPRRGRSDHEAVAIELAAHGVTSYLPTLCSTDPAGYRLALGAVHEAVAEPPPGARVLGAHLEGPFLSPTWPGVHQPASLLPPDLELVESLLAAGPVRMVTLAPELPGADRVVDRLVSAGVVVAIGHSDAPAAVVHGAIDRGATMLTHCHNAHRRWAARDPGPAGVALVRSEVTVGLIGDLVHLAPETVLATFAAAGGRVALVSDLVPTSGPNRLGAPDDEGIPRAGGALAGSAVALDEVLRRLIGIGLDPAAVLGAMSVAPARVLGTVADLRPGAPADVVVLDDRWEVESTIVAGREVHRGGARS